MLRRYYQHIMLVVFSMLMASCVEEYQPDLSRYEEVLVVDGSLTNDAGPYTVTLTKSGSVYNPTKNFYSGANVSIVDETGNQEPLKEYAEGKYATINPDFRGEVGKSYKVVIELRNGKLYESSYETLQAAPPIDSVYAEIRREPTENEYYTREGLQFYVDTKNQLNSSAHLLWRMEETYEYHSDFTIDYIFRGALLENPEPYIYYKCFKTSYVPNTVVYSSNLEKSKRIVKLPLTYIDTETKKLSIRYSLLVKQFSVSESAANYWYQINKQNEEQGTFYSRQPYQIVGNVKNLDNPDEPVLGYFIVGGIEKKRIFVDRPWNLNFYYSECTLNPEGMAYIWLTPQSDWPVYVGTESDGVTRGIASKYCFDCRLRGGELEEPDFWE